MQITYEPSGSLADPHEQTTFVLTAENCGRTANLKLTHPNWAFVLMFKNLGGSPQSTSCWQQLFKHHHMQESYARQLENYRLLKWKGASN